nr:immunoglobulin heavy chain junction region [Macaca mulatta]
CARKHETFDSW